MKNAKVIIVHHLIPCLRDGSISRRQMATEIPYMIHKKKLRFLTWCIVLQQLCPFLLPYIVRSYCKPTREHTVYTRYIEWGGLHLPLSRPLRLLHVQSPSPFSTFSLKSAVLHMTLLCTLTAFTMNWRRYWITFSFFLWIHCPFSHHGFTLHQGKLLFRFFTTGDKENSGWLARCSITVGTNRSPCNRENLPS